MVKLTRSSTFSAVSWSDLDKKIILSSLFQSDQQVGHSVGQVREFPSELASAGWQDDGGREGGRLGTGAFRHDGRDMQKALNGWQLYGLKKEMKGDNHLFRGKWYSIGISCAQ